MSWYNKYQLPPRRLCLLQRLQLAAEWVGTYCPTLLYKPTQEHYAEYIYLKKFNVSIMVNH